MFLVPETADCTFVTPAETADNMFGAPETAGNMLLAPETADCMFVAPEIVEMFVVLEKAHDAFVVVEAVDFLVVLAAILLVTIVETFDVEIVARHKIDDNFAVVNAEH